MRKAAALLVEKKPRGATQQPKPKTNSDLDVVKRCIKEVLAADELIALVKEVRDTDYLRELIAAATKVLDGAAATNRIDAPTGLRRM